MALSQNAKLQFEAGQTLVDYHLLTDSGDHATFSSASSPWSKASGKEPIIRPNGLITGGAVTPAVSGTNDLVDVAALTCYLAGVLTSVNADTDVAITRAVSTDTHIINSITVKSDGTIEVVTGTDSTAFSETRGAAGGPPLIPVGSIEIAQVRTTSNSAGAITADEIFDVVGQHQERYDYPAWEIDPFDGEITFASALPLIHTGPTARRNYARVYTPIFQDVVKAIDFVPIETTHSTSTQEYYGGVIGSTSSSIGQGAFTALLNDGHTDSLLGSKDDTLMFKFYQDRNKSPYSLTQGKLGVSRTYPKNNQVQASCTISGEEATRDYTS